MTHPLLYVSNNLASLMSIIINLKPKVTFYALEEKSSAMLVEFGASEKIIAEMLFGEREPIGNFPFELPNSQEAVEKQLEDVPYDSKDPLYPFGFGLHYPENKTWF